jgi:hypothetical protein
MTILIYCASHGRRYADIAVAAGFAYGCRAEQKRSPYPVTFCDLDWKQPKYAEHMTFVKQTQPVFAVAPDLLDPTKLGQTLSYARRLADFARYAIIVPKYDGAIRDLPHEPWLVLGYSVPTKYGGTEIPVEDFMGRPVHLLGGNPMNQMALAERLHVISADGNAHQGAARHGVVYDATEHRWKARHPAVPAGPDLPYRAFAYSCAQIQLAWAQQGGRNEHPT